MTRPIRRLILLNQMAGPLFRELAEGLADEMPDGCLLLTGHPDALTRREGISPSLTVQPAPAYERRSLLHRLFSWLRYLWSATRVILGANREDAFLVVSNPPILGLLVWLLTRWRRIPYAMLVYDIYPDILITLKILKETGIPARSWRAVNHRILNDAQAVITIGDHMAMRLRRQFDGDPTVIPPWADTNCIRPLPKEQNPLTQELNPDHRVTVLYSGNMGNSHDIDSMLAAALLLQDRKDIQFLFIGGGSKWPEAVAFAQQHDFENLRVLPFQPEDRLPWSMAIGDISLVALDPGAEGIMVPSKTFYYMASGAAIIAISQGSNELKDLVENNSCGMCVPPNSPKMLAKAIAMLVDDPTNLQNCRDNARNAAERLYSRTVGVAAFLAVLSDAGLVPSGTPQP